MNFQTRVNNQRAILGLAKKTNKRGTGVPRAFLGGVFAPMLDRVSEGRGGTHERTVLLGILRPGYICQVGDVSRHG